MVANMVLFQYEISFSLFFQAFILATNTKADLT